jgi:uncharacterized protein
MPSSEQLPGLTPEARRHLLALAFESIERGLNGERTAIGSGRLPEALTVQRASFVTLHIESRLRGCIGTLEAVRALAEDVAANAYSAAFEDRRFPPLSRGEFARLDVHISILSAPQAIACASEAELLAQLRPQVDGLIIEEGFMRGTFLPSVWEQLPDPRDFLHHLKRKAGMPVDYWSARIRVRRYTVESFNEA